jgi:Mg2+/Co2+ transporter CorB
MYTSFLQPPVTSSLFGTNILLSTLFSNTLSLCYCLNVRDQVSHIIIIIIIIIIIEVTVQSEASSYPDRNRVLFAGPLSLFLDFLIYDFFPCW